MRTGRWSALWRRGSSTSVGPGRCALPRPLPGLALGWILTPGFVSSQIADLGCSRCLVLIPGLSRPPVPGQVVPDGETGEPGAVPLCTLLAFPTIGCGGIRSHLITGASCCRDHTCLCTAPKRTVAATTNISPKAVVPNCLLLECNQRSCRLRGGHTRIPPLGDTRPLSELLTCRVSPFFLTRSHVPPYCCPLAGFPGSWFRHTAIAVHDEQNRCGGAPRVQVTLAHRGRGRAGFLRNLFLLLAQGLAAIQRARGRGLWDRYCFKDQFDPKDKG